MKIIRSLVIVSSCMLVSFSAGAADQDDHSAHHSEAASKASSVEIKSAAKNELKKYNAMAQESMEKMDSQMKKMNEMHEKMMAAKTPDERKALMAEHRKAMQEGMAMMNNLSKSGGMSMMGSMSRSDTMKGDGKGKMQNEMQCDMDCDMATHYKTMEKRMQMMEAMMQMMTDHMSLEPSSYTR